MQYLSCFFHILNKIYFSFLPFLHKNKGLSLAFFISVFYNITVSFYPICCHPLVPQNIFIPDNLITNTAFQYVKITRERIFIMKLSLVYISIILAFYILGGYATTDMLRLLRGSVLSVNHADCCCPVCGQKIKIRHQLPVISYFLNNRQCASCKSTIPVSEVLLELLVSVPMILTACLLHFSWNAYLACIAYYELFKIALILFYGKRKTAFAKNYILSLINNAVLFLMLAFFFLLIYIG